MQLVVGENATYLKDTYKDIGINFILTNRLNQDILENLFAYLRATGATHDHPSAFDIQRRMRLFILGKHSGIILSSGIDTEGPTEPNLINISNTSEISDATDTVLTCILNEESFSEENDVANQSLNVEIDEYYNQAH